MHHYLSSNTNTNFTLSQYSARIHRKKNLFPHKTIKNLSETQHRSIAIKRK